MNIDTAQLLTVGQVRKRASWSMPPHRHPFHELIAVLEGKMHIITPQISLCAAPGDVLFYAAGMTHEEHSDAADPVRTLFISFTWEDYVPSVAVKAHDAARRVGTLIQWLFEERFAMSSLSGAVRALWAHAALAEYLRLVAYQEPNLVERVRQFIRARVADTISVDELANWAGMSKFHFIRSYKKISGQTPMADVRRIRVELARDLLLTTDLPLKQIALRVGCAHEHHLSRLTQQYLGMPPSALRMHVSWNNLPAIEEH